MLEEIQNCDTTLPGVSILEKVRRVTYKKYMYIPACHKGGSNYFKANLFFGKPVCQAANHQKPFQQKPIHCDQLLHY